MLSLARVTSLGEGYHGSLSIVRLISHELVVRALLILLVRFVDVPTMPFLFPFQMPPVHRLSCSA